MATLQSQAAEVGTRKTSASTMAALGVIGAVISLSFFGSSSGAGTGFICLLISGAVAVLAFLSYQSFNSKKTVDTANLQQEISSKRDQLNQIQQQHGQLALRKTEPH
jgi:hypothetical protein